MNAIIRPHHRLSPANNEKCMNVRSLQNYSEVACCQAAKSEAQLGFRWFGTFARPAAAQASEVDFAREVDAPFQSLLYVVDGIELTRVGDEYEASGADRENSGIGTQTTSRSRRLLIDFYYRFDQPDFHFAGLRQGAAVGEARERRAVLPSATVHHRCMGVGVLGLLALHEPRPIQRCLPYRLFRL